MGFIRAFVCVSRAPAQAQGHDPPDSYNPTRQAVPSIRVSTAPLLLAYDPPDSYNPTRQAVPSIRVSTAPPLLAYLPAHGAAFLAIWRTSIASRRQTDSGSSTFQL